MPLVKYAANLITHKDPIIEEFIEGTILLDVLNAFVDTIQKPEIKYTKVFIYLNSVKIDNKDWNGTSVQPDDIVEIIPYVGDFGVSAGLTMVAGWIIDNFFTIAAYSALIYSGYRAYDYARDYLNELNDLNFDDYSGNTNTYSWTGANTTSSEGIPIPIIYGTHQVGGNVISELIKGSETKLSVALALGEGPLDFIDTTTCYINDLSVADLASSDIDFDTSTNGGYVPFGGSVTTIGMQIDPPPSANHSLYDIDGIYGFLGWVESSIGTGTEIQRYSGTGFSFPPVTWLEDAKGDDEHWSNPMTSSVDGSPITINLLVSGYHVPIILRYKYVGDEGEQADWTYYGGSILGKLYRPVDGHPHTYAFGIDTVPTTEAGWTALYEEHGLIMHEETPVSSADWMSLWGTLHLSDFGEDVAAFTDEFLDFFYHEFVSPYDIFIYYDGLYIVTTNGFIQGSEIQVPKNVSFEIPKSPYADYPRIKAEIKVMDYLTYHSVVLQNISEYTGDHWYENTALMTAVFNKATEAINGTTPSFKIPVRGISNVRVYNSGLTYTEQWTSNPVWCLLDLLTNKRYGMGEWVTYEDIDLSAAYTAATYCDSINFIGEEDSTSHVECNIVLDSNVEIMEAVVSILETFNGMIFIGANGKIKVIVDKEESLAQVFTSANIIKDSLTYSFNSRQNANNALEIRYADRDNGNLPYDQTAIFLSTGDVPVKEQQISLKGVTFLQQATFIGSYKLKKALLCNQSVSFKTNYSALACEPGDIIGIQDNSVNATYGGNFISYSSVSNTRSCVIDQDASISTGDYITYSFLGETDLDSTTTTISNYNASTRTVTFTSTVFPSDSTTGISYIIYSTGTTLTKFRVMSIRQNIEDRTFDISCVKYDPLVYESGDLTIIPTPGTTEDFSAPPVLNFTVILREDGQSVSVFYQAPTSRYYYSARLEYKNSNSTAWTLAAIMPFCSGYIISGLLLNNNYDFRVVSINQAGVLNLAQAVTYTLTTTLSDIYPPDVTGLQIVGRGTLTTYVERDCRIAWDAVHIPSTEPALLGYVVEITVNGVLVRREVTSTNNYTYSYAMNVEDNGSAQRIFTFNVYSENISFRLSENPATLTVENLSASYPTGLVANFTGNDCIISWTPPASTIVDHYDIEVYSEYNLLGTLLRTDTSYDSRYNYRFSYNYADTSGVPDRTLSFGIRTVDSFAHQSDYVIINAENDAPSEVMSSAVATGVLGGVCITWVANSSETDVIGYDIYTACNRAIEQAIDFETFVNTTSITISSIHDGSGGSVQLESGDELHVIVVPRDKFGPGDFPASDVSATVRGTELENWEIDVPWPSGVEFTAHEGYVSWTSGSIIFANTEYAIAADTTSDRVIYWVEGEENFRTAADTNSLPLDSDTWVMAYFDGLDVWPADAHKIIHGGLIQASTITGDQIYGETLSSIKSYTGSLEVDTSGYLRGGQTDYDTGTGFWLGYDDGAYKFSLGNNSEYIKFDGVNLVMNGSITIEGSVDWDQVVGRPTDLASLDSTSANKLDGIENNATNGASWIQVSGRPTNLYDLDSTASNTLDDTSSAVNDLQIIVDDTSSAVNSLQLTLDDTSSAVTTIQLTIDNLGDMAESDWASTYNVVRNGDYARWRNGATSVPDEWIMSGGSVAQESTIKVFGGYSMCYTSTTSASYVYQDLSNTFGIAYWKGRKIIAGAWVRASVASRVRLRITDGYTDSYSEYHAGDSQWAFLTVALDTPVNSSATSVNFYVPYISAGTATSVYCDGALAVEGEIIPQAWIPYGGMSAPSGSGLILDSDFIGFFSDNMWKSYIDSHGNLSLRVGTSDYGFRFFGEDTGDFGAGDLIIGEYGGSNIYWDIDPGTLSINDADLTLSGGKTLTVIGDATTGSPALINWVSDDYGVSAFLGIGGGDRFYIRPVDLDSCDHVDMFLGNVDYPFFSASIYSQTSSVIKAYHDANNFAQVGTVELFHSAIASMGSASGASSITRQAYVECEADYDSSFDVVTLYAATGNIRTHGKILPMSGHSDVFDIGSSTEYYHDVWAYQMHMRTTWYAWDIIDDLQALKEISTLKNEDGSEILTEDGIPLLNPLTLPEKMLSRYESDTPDLTYEADDGSVIKLKSGHKKGEVVYDVDGMPFVNSAQLSSFTLCSSIKLGKALEECLKRIEVLESKLKDKE